MFNLKNMLKSYEKYMLNGEFHEADVLGFEIYVELLEYGFLPEDINTMNKVAEILKEYSSDVGVEILVELTETIIGYANADLDGDIEEQELGETPLDKLVLVQHNLDLVEGTKNSEVLPYIFNSIDEVNSFVEFKLDIEELEENLMKIDRGTIGVQFADRDSMYDSLMATEMVEGEVIADNLPETSVGVNLLLSFDLKTEKIVKAVIIAAYEMSEYPTI